MGAVRVDGGASGITHSLTKPGYWSSSFRRSPRPPKTDQIKKLVPNKPIRYVMNTHPHSDHTGGLPVLVAEGATIVTQKNNEKFLEQALNTPRTLLNDTLAKNPKKVKIEAVGEKKVYSDGTRTVEIYHVAPDTTVAPELAEVPLSERPAG